MNQPVAPVAIVTGAGRGIGRATAAALGRLGYQLALVARSAEQLAETAKLVEAAQPAEVGNASRGIEIIPADVALAESSARIVEKTTAAFGRVDALVHCAGVAPARPIVEMSTEQWHEVIDTNLSSAFYLMRAVWPVFVRQGNGGVIVNISSQAARDPFPGLGVYAAAKAGLNLLGLSAAREGAKSGIRVHTIAPGATETAMLRLLADVEQLPPENTMSPQDVATVIVGCVSGSLKYASGETIYLQKLV